MNTLELPTINLAGLSGPNEGGEGYVEIVDSLRECCEEHGFFCVENHGISQVLMDQALEVTKAYFGLSEEAKTATVQNPKPNFSMQERGYVGAEFANKNPLNNGFPLDLNEGFIVGKQLSEDQTVNLNALEILEEYSPNIWPQEIPRMKTIINQYYAEAERLAFAIHAVMQQTLDFSIPSPSMSSSLLRLNYYPEITFPVLPNQWRITEHADCCMLTVLLTERSKERQATDDAYSGLEVLHKKQGWTKAVYSPTSLVINCGDTLEYFSNGRCRSSLHRVGVPKVARSHNSRVSLAFFMHAEYSANKYSLNNYDKLRKQSLNWVV